MGVQDKRPFGAAGLLLAALLAAAWTAPGPVRGADGAGRERLVVACDDTYPPFIFRGDDGSLRGILPDQWRLWEKKTGVAVELRAMDWAAAQSVMRAGKADVIDTIFLNPERAARYDFTAPYATIRVPVYVHNKLGGIADIASLKGFLVGVKDGDAVIDYLAGHGVTNIKRYPSYEAIVQAAERDEIRVFSTDEPPGVHYLCKYGLVKRYREAFTLYAGQFHRAVRKNDTRTLELVQRGFDACSRRELRAIDRKWRGTPFSLWALVRPLRIWAAAALAVMVVLALSNVLLRHRVRAKTKELRLALDNLKKSAREMERADRALRENHDLIVQFMRHSPILVYIKEVAGTSVRLLMASENFRQLTGIAGPEMAGKTMEELFPPEFAAKMVAKDLEVMEQGEVQSFEEEFNGRQYTTIKFPIVSGGRRLLAGYTIDTTERRRADAERERLTRAIEQASETVLITDARGDIVYVNPAFTRITGYTREEVLGRSPRFLRSGRHDADFYRQMWETVLGGRTWSRQVVNKRKDGTLFTEQASLSPVRDSAGKIVNIVAVKRDITGQLRAEEEKAALQAQLAHVQKLESIGRLAGGIAHDFNNMLQAILGYTEIALGQVLPRRPLYNDLMEIKKAAERSVVLTRQLQTFARKDTTTASPVDINAAVENMLAMLRRLIGGGVTLEWSPGENSGFVFLDPGQVDQLVVNLVINARDAVGTGGRIELATAEATVPAARAAAFRGLSPGAYTVFSIRDNGCGMAPEVAEHVFEPFFTTKPSGCGTGLGLSVVYGIVKRAGGHIRVTSEPGKGALFEVYLPRYSRAPASAAPPAGESYDSATAAN